MGKVKFQIESIDENSWYFDGAIGRAFLFKGTKKALLVDTTNGPGDLRQEAEKLVDGLPIILMNTHGDGDHIGCNEQFDTTLMNPCEFSYYATKCKKGDAKPVPLHDGDKIDIGGREFEAILTPGHTPGSMVLLNRKERFLVGGDTILNIVFIFGPQRNLLALIDSLEKLQKNYSDAFDRIYCAHFDLIADTGFIQKELNAAKALLNGELTGVDPGQIPLEGPDFKPAALYMGDGAGFFDYKELNY
jgi:hydroxyacylglutathione hydrolase